MTYFIPFPKNLYFTHLFYNFPLTAAGCLNNIAYTYMYMYRYFVVVIAYCVQYFKKKKILTHFGTSAPKRKAEVKFHCPVWFPNGKAEVGVHYSFWNFCFQFEKPNRVSTFRFTPETKGGTVGVELSFWNMNGRAKSTSHYPFWNPCSKWKPPK